MKKEQFLVAILSLVLLTGCDPQQRLTWSPDGKRVAVIASDGLRVGDDSGKISGPILPNVSICRWLPDSIHAVVIAGKVSADWNEVKEALTESERNKVAQFAKTLWLHPNSKPLSIEDKSQPVVIYLVKKYGARAVKARLSRNRNFKVADEIHILVKSLEVRDLTAESPKATPVLWRTIGDVNDVRISPQGGLAAVSGGSAVGIILVPLQGGAPKMVAESTICEPDWSTDGQSLYYVHTVIAPKSNEPKTTGDITAMLDRLDIVGAKGEILQKSVSKELLELYDLSESRIRCLPDGSIVFNSHLKQYPSIKEKVDTSKNSLFRLSADLKSVEPIVPLGDLICDELKCFEPNQDGTKIAIPGEHGEVDVIDLASRAVTVFEKKGTNDTKFIPQWRTNDELCYPARNYNKTPGQHDVDVVLQSLTDPSRRANLSKEWPYPASQFLNDPKKTEDKDNKAAKPAASSH